MRTIGNLQISGSLLTSGSITATTFIGDGSGLSGTYTNSDTLSYINSLNVVSSSAQLSTEISGAFVSTSASLASDISNNDSRLTTLEGKTLISSSIQLSNQTIPGNLTVGGILTAQEFHTEFVSASIIYDSGSTQFGNSLDDIHNFSGSLAVNTNNLFVSGGNVGIGTTSPSGRLHIVNTSGSTTPSNYLTVEGSTSNNSNYPGIELKGGTLSDISYPNIRLSNGGLSLLLQSGYGSVYQERNEISLNTAFGIGLFTSTSGAAVERMRITSNGNVGIGTTTPQGKLSISDGTIYVGRESNTTQTNNLLNGYGYRIGTSIYGNVSIRSTYINTTNAGSLDFYTASGATSTTERMRITSDGNVGIGTTSPSYKLHVNGSVAGVGAYVNLSDINWKKNINDLTDGLDKVLQLRPVTFNWLNEEYGDRLNTGFIAQEVEDILPDMVTTADDGVKSLATTDLIPLLVKSIQELKAEIDELRSEINLLKNQ